MDSPTKKSGGDPLNVERTSLANERTLLAYIRTALAFFITGGSALHFIDKPSYRAGGVIALIVGAATVLGGFIRYFQVRRHIQRIENGGSSGDED